MFIMTILFFLSLILNIVIIWYIVRLLNKLIDYSENMDDFFLDLENFSNHVEGLHELEMYYGDETLQSLIKHTKFILQRIKNFKEIFSLGEETEGSNVEEEEEQQKSLLHESP